jgi:hypothetical protein
MMADVARIVISELCYINDLLNILRRYTMPRTNEQQTKHDPKTQGYYYLHYDRALWRRFKACCAKQDMTMRSVIMALIESWVEEMMKK